ncbi:hypothetical protein ASD00_33805 [Ensifer sp. Root31]|uniref:LysR family transcriptional regulator n=1 Tax=Ensifer sp. Root31 TaxID=1736512 RepID=UPI000708FB26|nr:LysR family transcriptional regulator [Ensifer sp. Root31]KQU83878.1 hypothetical protein ASD00_33805 [Ensifer sp. Root31]
MSMNLRQMEVFRAVMREGSITAAAAALGISQPSVSEMLRHAEERCGIRLFERAKGRLRPTAYALRIRDDIETVFQQVAKVNRLINELKKERDVDLVLGCVYSLSLSLVPKIISQLYQVEPNVKPSVVAERRNDLTRKVSNGIIDGAISFLSEPNAGVETLVLREARPRFLCPKDHPFSERTGVSMADMGELTFIGYLPHLTMFSYLDDQFHKVGMNFRSVLDVEQIVQAWALVQARRGVAIVDPFCELDNLFPDVVSMEIVDADPLPLQFISCRGKPLSRTMQKLIPLIGIDAP